MTRDAQIIFESYRSKQTKVLTESHCEDYPACGHESGACPDEDGSYPCATCGTKLPKGNRSSICNSCHKRHAQSMDDADGGPYDNEDAEDTEDTDQSECTKCGSTKNVDARYSFGAYAGRLCLKCCGKYRDKCGVGQPEGDHRELDEPYWEEDDEAEDMSNYIPGRRDDDENDRFDDERPRRRNRYSCSDRMCGATDCSTCYPGDNSSDEDSEEPTGKRPTSKQNNSGPHIPSRAQRQAKHQAQLDQLKQMSIKGTPAPMSGDMLIAALRKFIANNPPHRDEDNVMRPSVEDVMKLVMQTQRQDADYAYSNMSAD